MAIQHLLHFQNNMYNVGRSFLMLLLFSCEHVTVPQMFLVNVEMV
jgi:hypothetical protein